MFSSHLSPISSLKNVLLCVHVLAYMYNLHVRAGVCMCHSMSVKERGQLLVVDSLLLCFEVWSLLFLPCCILQASWPRTSRQISYLSFPSGCRVMGNILHMQAAAPDFLMCILVVKFKSSGLYKTLYPLNHLDDLCHLQKYLLRRLLFI